MDQLPELGERDPFAWIRYDLHVAAERLPGYWHDEVNGPAIGVAALSRCRFSKCCPRDSYGVERNIASVCECSDESLVCMCVAMNRWCACV